MIGHIEKLREKLQSGRICLGSSVTFNDSAVTEALSASVDFLWIDLEHTPLTHESMTAHLIAARAGGVPAIVRVPGGEESWIKKALDCGAEGIILPRCNSAEDVRRFVSACRYPPLGTRGFGPRRPTNYGRIGPDDYIAWANSKLFVIAQIETAGAMEELDDIVAIDGLDSLVLGPFDLSGAIDRLGNIEGPVVTKAMQKVIDTARAAGKFIGSGVSANPRFAKMLADMGVQWIHVGCDYEYVRLAPERIFAEIRGDGTSNEHE
jgi:2-keto-3-deoxy-L-rhamnonate aldolase RhmA